MLNKRQMKRQLVNICTPSVRSARIKLGMTVVECASLLQMKESELVRIELQSPDAWTTSDVHKLKVLDNVYTTRVE